MFDLQNIPLPAYTRQEDTANCITHALGVPFCIIAAFLLLKMQIGKSPAENIIASVLYILSMLIVFFVSALYHGLRPSRAKQIARVIDHSDIYLLISGTVTAFALPSINDDNKSFTIALVSIIWGLSLLGVLLTFMDFKRFSVPQIFMYVILGWLAVLGLFFIFRNIEEGKQFIKYVLTGGALFTFGSVLYFIGKKHKYFHAVFHTFVLAGCILIFAGVYTYYRVLLLG